MALTTIDAQASPATLRELWRAREILFFLAWRDLKVRYRQTVLGVLWTLLQPLLTMAVFALLFGRLGRMPSDGVPYALFALAGLLPWIFFSNAVTMASNSLAANPDLLTKVYVPRMLLPGAVVVAHLVDFAIAYVLLMVAMVYFERSVSATIVLLPFLGALTALLAMGVSSWLAASSIRYRDVRYALPFIMQMWFFASPVIYPSTLVPGKLGLLLSLNPLTGIIDGYRWILFGRPFPGLSLLLSVIITLAVAVCAVRVFHRLEKSFADLV